MRKKRLFFISISLAIMAAVLGWCLLVPKADRGSHTTWLRSLAYDFGDLFRPDQPTVLLSLELNFEDLYEYHRQHGEYPEHWDVADKGLRMLFGDNPAYFTAKDESGKRFACLVVFPGPDGKLQINGECFGGSNVGKKPINWTPRECATDRYFVPDKKDVHRNAGKGDDWYFEFIWGKYCVMPIGQCHVGMKYTLDEISDLTDPLSVYRQKE